jgi:hypothetical protein
MCGLTWPVAGRPSSACAMAREHLWHATGACLSRETTSHRFKAGIWNADKQGCTPISADDRICGRVCGPSLGIAAEHPDLFVFIPAYLCSKYFLKPQTGLDDRGEQAVRSGLRLRRGRCRRGFGGGGFHLDFEYCRGSCVDRRRAVLAVEIRRRVDIRVALVTSDIQPGEPAISLEHRTQHVAFTIDDVVERLTGGRHRLGHVHG